MSTVTPSPASRTRPKDRRDQIVAEATRLFIERGYHAVRMEDIAAATGITASALYRHDRNKHALLERVLAAGQGRWREAFIDPQGEIPTERLDDTIARLASAAIDFPQPALLFQREARHLEPDAYRVVRQRLTWFTDQVRARLVEVRPELDPASVEMLAWGVIGVAGSGDRHRAALPRPEFDELLAAAGRAVAAVPVSGAGQRDGRVGGDGLAPASRREQLLAAAARLFRRKGFLGTSIDEVAAEAGMAGPAIYRHFDSKADLLEVLLTRFAEWRTLETYRALRESTDRGEARRHLVGRYAALAFDYPDLVGVSLTEVIHLPDAARRAVERRDDEFCDELAAHAGGGHTGRVLAGAARGVIDDLVRIPRLRPHLSAAQLAIMAGAVLDVRG